MLLCVAVAIAWAVSYGRDLSAGRFGNFPFGSSRDAAQNFRFKFGGFGYAAWVREGGVCVYWQELRSETRRLAVGSQWAKEPGTVLGFGLNRAPDDIPAGLRSRWARQGTLHVPLWFPLCLTAIGPAVWLLEFRRRRRARRWAREGRCAACGYDLAGNTSGICPECGTGRAAA